MRIKRPRTLAVRLTLWYGSVFILSAGLAFFSFYLLMTNILLDRTDQELLSQARTLQAVFESRNLAAVKAVMIREAKAAGERKVFFRLLYIDGSAFSSTNLTSWKTIEVSRIAIRHLLEGENRVLETV
ncbi:MAG: two-component sensor histidine kinase, partial [Thermodesulfobacteriota bacterium]